MRNMMWSKATALLVLVLVAVPSVNARDCGGVLGAISEAGSKLKRTAQETSFDDAQSAVRRAKSALEDAASASSECGCDSAYSEFDDAATRARRAQYADDVNEFKNQFKRAIRAYNDGVEEARSCLRAERG